MAWITAPCCERCWVKREGARIPVRLTEAELEMCYFCKVPTVVGIYVRVEKKDYGWACTDPDCNVTDPGPYTEAEADRRRETHELTHVVAW